MDFNFSFQKILIKSKTCKYSCNFLDVIQRNSTRTKNYLDVIQLNPWMERVMFFLLNFGRNSTRPKNYLDVIQPNGWKGLCFSC